MKILLETLYLSIKRLKARNNKGGLLNCPYSVPKFFDFMATRRRTSATKTAKTATASITANKIIRNGGNSSTANLGGESSGITNNTKRMRI